QRNPHRAEVVRSADADVGFVTVVVSGSAEAARTVAASQRQPADSTGGLHAWQRPKPFEDLLVKRELVGRISGGRKRQVEGQEMIGIEAGTHLHESRETLDQ